MARLKHVRGQVADVMEHTRRVQAVIGGCLKRHFEMIPPLKVILPAPN
jgi:hypothetical protein